MNAGATEMQAALGKARRLAADTLMREFPDLYILSAKAFDERLNSTAHFKRLGQYLLSADSELGTSPIEALADGRRADVLQQLAALGGVDPSSIRFVDVPAVKVPDVLRTDAGPPHVAYCEYHATGEGVTVMVAVGGSAESARRTFLECAPGYFHRGMEEDVLTEDAGPATRRIRQWVPKRVLDQLASKPNGAPTYFSTFHFNLA